MTRPSKNIIIAGASQAGHEILDIIKEKSLFESILFYDELLKGENIFNDSTLFDKSSEFIISIGQVDVRERIFDMFEIDGFIPSSIISNKSWVSPKSKIDPGVVVYPMCNIATMAHVEKNVLINFQTSISHGVKIGAHSNICPGVLISGNVTIGRNVYVGIGTVIKEKVNICDRVVIGANSTVLSDITVPGTYFGTPCKLITKN